MSRKTFSLVAGTIFFVGGRSAHPATCHGLAGSPCGLDDPCVGELDPRSGGKLLISLNA